LTASHTSFPLFTKGWYPYFLLRPPPWRGSLSMHDVPVRFFWVFLSPASQTRPPKPNLNFFFPLEVGARISFLLPPLLLSRFFFFRPPAAGEGLMFLFSVYLASWLKTTTVTVTLPRRMPFGLFSSTRSSPTSLSLVRLICFFTPRPIDAFGVVNFVDTPPFLFLDGRGRFWGPAPQSPPFSNGEKGSPFVCQKSRAQPCYAGTLFLGWVLAPPAECGGAITSPFLPSPSDRGFVLPLLLDP